VGVDARREGTVLRIPIGAEFEDKHLLMNDLTEAMETLAARRRENRLRHISQEYALISVDRLETLSKEIPGDSQSEQVSIPGDQLVVSADGVGPAGAGQDPSGQGQAIAAGEPSYAISPVLIGSIADASPRIGVRAPLNLPDVPEQQVATKRLKSRLLLVISALAIALVLAVGAVFHVALQQSEATPDLILRAKEENGAPGLNVNAIQRLQGSSPLAPFANGSSSGKMPEKSGTELKLKALPESRADAEVTVPAHFRSQSTVFWFVNKSEEDTFLETVTALPSERKIRLVGHPTDLEERSGRSELGLRRALAIAKYLERKGINPKRIEAIKGTPVPAISDKDKDGPTLNRWVGVILK
jgi:hypothetical protein